MREVPLRGVDRAGRTSGRHSVQLAGAVSARRDGFAHGDGTEGKPCLGGAHRNRPGTCSWPRHRRRRAGQLPSTKRTCARWLRRDGMPVAVATVPGTAAVDDRPITERPVGHPVSACPRAPAAQTPVRRLRHPGRRPSPRHGRPQHRRPDRGTEGRRALRPAAYRQRASAGSSSAAREWPVTKGRREEEREGPGKQGPQRQEKRGRQATRAGPEARAAQEFPGAQAEPTGRASLGSSRKYG